MTVEERAKNVIDKTAVSGWEYDTLFREIAQALRDQIEDCAKIADERNKTLNALNPPNQRLMRENAIEAYGARLIANSIRTLAAPGESKTEEKED